MISNERPSPFGNRSFERFSKPQVHEETIKSERIQIERKTFVFAIKENPRGRFMRITEDVGGRRDTIIVPLPGLEAFKEAVDRMVRAAAELPEKLDKPENPDGSVSPDTPGIPATPENPEKPRKPARTRHERRRREEERPPPRDLT